MKHKVWNSKDIALTGVFAALYAVGVLALAPISFMLVQVRVADALLTLTMLFGYPAIIGVTVGCLIANFFGGLGIVDLTLGPLANFLACLLGYYVGKHSRLGGSLTITALITLIVGGYLALLFGFPIYVGWGFIGVGSVVSIIIVGLPLTYALEKRIWWVSIRGSPK
jgi:uncharacterized membrane protein